MTTATTDNKNAYTPNITAAAESIRLDASEVLNDLMRLVQKLEGASCQVSAELSRGTTRHDCESLVSARKNLALAIKRINSAYDAVWSAEEDCREVIRFWEDLTAGEASE